ncbi:MAG: hypothetical protein GY943_35080 [Chloroflexi bacterium]|nr:hypothetical protein [Chloroflexota bacterium]
MNQTLIKFTINVFLGFFVVTVAGCTSLTPKFEEAAIDKQFPVELVTPLDLSDSKLADREQIAYCYYDQIQEMKIIDLDTSSTHNIDQSLWTSPLGVDLGCVHGVAWSPKGDQLLLGVGGPNGLLSADITQEGRQISENEFFNLPQYTYYERPHLPVWAPDGEFVAFVSNQSISFPSVYLASENGKDIKQLTDSFTLPGVTSEPVWSHDGTKIAYAMPYPDNGIGIIDRESSDVITFNQDNITQFSPGVDDVHGLMPNRSIAWLPGDNLILFLTNSDSKEADILWVMAPDGSNLMELYEGAIKQIELSPDGKMLAIVLIDNNQSKILILHLDQNLRTETILDSLTWKVVTNTTTEFKDLDWSPDGSQLAFSANPNGNYDIFLWNQQDRETNLLIGTSADETMPLWRPSDD